MSGSRNLISVSILASLVWSSLIVANGYLISTIIVTLIDKSGGVAPLSMTLAGLWIFRALFQSQFERWCGLRASEVKRELRTRLVAEMGTASYSAAELTTLAIKRLNSLDVYVGRFVPQLIFSTTTPLIVIATIFTLDFLSGVITIITLPLIPLFGALIGKYTSDAVMKKWRELGSLARYFEDSMRGFVTLHIFGRHRSQPQRIEEMGKRYTNETMKVLRISFLSSLVLELCATISVALIAVSIGIRLVDGAIAFAPSLMVLILAPEVYFPLRNAAALFHASADGSEVISALTMEKSSSAGIQRKTFSWEHWNNPYLQMSVLPGEIPPFSARRLHGESGMGKTTFALNLVSSLDNQQLAWIPQHPTFVRGTVREQFLLVNKDLSDDQIVELFRDVNLDLADLPSGLNTEIGGRAETSSMASGGQLRKIAIARALAKRPHFMIADEPTADVDGESAKKIVATLADFVQQGGSLLVISHDRSFDHIEKIEVDYRDR